jgi:hypothetical protein
MSVQIIRSSCISPLACTADFRKYNIAPMLRRGCSGGTRAGRRLTGSVASGESPEVKVSGQTECRWRGVARTLIPPPRSRRRIWLARFPLGGPPRATWVFSPWSGSLAKGPSSDGWLIRHIRSRNFWVNIRTMLLFICNPNLHVHRFAPIMPKRRNDYLVLRSVIPS